CLRLSLKMLCCGGLRSLAPLSSLNLAPPEPNSFSPSWTFFSLFCSSTGGAAVTFTEDGPAGIPSSFQRERMEVTVVLPPKMSGVLRFLPGAVVLGVLRGVSPGNAARGSIPGTSPEDGRGLPRRGQGPSAPVIASALRAPPAVACGGTVRGSRRPRYPPPELSSSFVLTTMPNSPAQLIAASGAESE